MYGFHLSWFRCALVSTYLYLHELVLLSNIIIVQCFLFQAIMTSSKTLFLSKIKLSNWRYSVFIRLSNIKGFVLVVKKCNLSSFQNEQTSFIVYFKSFSLYFFLFLSTWKTVVTSHENSGNARGSLSSVGSDSPNPCNDNDGKFLLHLHWLNENPGINHFGCIIHAKKKKKFTSKMIEEIMISICIKKYKQFQFMFDFFFQFICWCAHIFPIQCGLYSFFFYVIAEKTNYFKCKFPFFLLPMHPKVQRITLFFSFTNLELWSSKN